MLPLVLLSCACDIVNPDDNSPRLIRVQVAEGVATCPGCPLTGRDVTPGADNVLTVRPNVTYTFRAVVRTSADPNKCVYNAFHISWDPPDRTFDCFPEADREITLDRVTGSSGVPTESSRVTLSLTEYEIDSRQQLSSKEIRTYTVRIVP
jgi:hypothetical protein